MHSQKNTTYLLPPDQLDDQARLAYWRTQLTGELPVLNVPTDHARSATALLQGETYTLDLHHTLAVSLRQQEETLAQLLFGTFSVLLYRYTGQERFWVGTHTLAPNPLLRSNYSKAPFVILSDFASASTFTEFMGKIDTLSQENIYPVPPYAVVAAELGVERQVWQQLFRVMFDLYTTHEPPRETDGDTAQAYDLWLVIQVSATKVTATFKYNAQLYERATIARMAGHFECLLRAIIDNPEQAIKRLPLLTAAERQQLLIEWNQTGADYPDYLCIHQLFEAQAVRTPNALAVIFNQQALTYGELNAQANQVAHYLQQLGVQPNMLVGICMERSLEMLIGLLGILKAGAAYVPLDPMYPAERIAFILEDAKVHFLLIKGQSGTAFKSNALRLVDLEQDWAEIAAYAPENPTSTVTSQHLAYTIYTSGSTGRPKGVALKHQTVVNFLYSVGERPGLTANDTLVAVTTIAFDIAGLELYLPLTKGAKVVIASDKVVADGYALARLLDDAQATVMQATPATWRLLLLSDWQGRSNLKILCGGEAFPTELARKLLACSASVWNMYGPTETTIWSTVYQVTADDTLQQGVVSIGRPIANTQIYIVDEQQQLTPIGVPGELLIGGAGLAQGYLNRPELTAERFVADPFAADPVARLYKTGDLARYRADGNIEFMGRMDHQIKLRGFRIELGEIESVLNDHPAVEQSVVTVREDAYGEKHLTAYVVPNRQKVLPIPDWQLHTLPNRLPFSVINKMEADHLYELIFEHQVYMKHGIRLPEDACVLDVGANIGLFMLFVHQHSPRAKLYAFEPVPDVFALLRTNAELYQVDAELLMVGLSSEAGSFDLTYYPNWSALSGLHGNIDDEEELSRAFMAQHYGELAEYSEDWLTGRFQGQTVTCELRTISQVMREYNIETVDLLKINVEKSELNVLLGIADEDWPKIKRLAVEVHKGEGRLSGVEDLLRAHGYHTVIEQNEALKGTVLHMVYAWQPGTDELPISSPRAVAVAKPLLKMADLQKRLQAYLPPYMIPSSVMALPALPLTPNGKIDRNALPIPSARHAWIQNQTAYVPPSHEIEQRIANIWQDVLGVSTVGVLDRFFELGGNSLLAAQVHNRLTQSLPAFTMSLIEMLEHPTIRALSEQLSQTKEQPSASDMGQARAAKRMMRGQQRREQRRSNREKTH
ncbi:MAG: amino acid adenylation domain-containing protein [Caldilineaceae bacterium]